jgi:AcrR family transcriptional regulator
MKNQPSRKKYIDIVATGRELFWKHGFRRVTIEEICHKAGVSKMTYYKYFRNKTELAKTVFQKEVEEGEAKFRELMQKDIAPSELIQQIILLKMESTTNISREFLEDFYTGEDSALLQFVNEVSHKAWQTMLVDFRDAQCKGIFRKDFKPEFLIQVSFKMVEFLKDEQLLSLYDNPQDLILEFSKFIAYGISPHS